MAENVIYRVYYMQYIMCMDENRSSGKGWEEE